jgi:hypothetical protein
MIYAKEFDTEEGNRIFTHLDYYLDHAGQPLKRSRGRTIGLISLQGKLVVVKRYNIRGFWHGLKISLRPSRASKSWMNAFRLKEMGIQSISPVALIEKRRGPLRNVCYFLCEYIEAGIPGCHYFVDESVTKLHWPVAINAIENLLEKMHQHHLYHSDLHFGNLLMVNHQPYLLDLDKLRQYPAKSVWYKILKKKDIDMLRNSLNEYPQAKINFKIHQSANMLRFTD